MTTTLPKLIADLELSLQVQVFAGDVVATLNSNTDDDGNTLPTGIYGFTISLDETDKEFIVCSLSGTALTNIVSINKQGASSVGFSNYHRAGSTVTITDWIVLKRILDNLTGATGFDSTANLGYDGPPTGLTGNQLATVNYVLSVVNGGPVTFDQQVVSNQTLGETITAGNIVYFKQADQRWYKTSATLTATVIQTKLGIALSSGIAGGTSNIAISGTVNNQTGLTAGLPYYVSNTAGALSSTPGTYNIFVGWALSTTAILLSTNIVYLPINTVASAANPAINTDTTRFFSITAQAVNISSFTTSLTGSPKDSQTLWISITDNGTARTITWGASFEASTIALPTTTVISNRLDVFFVWNAATSKWRCMGKA